MYRGAVVRAICDHPDLELVGEAVDGEQALTMIQELAPDVALVDMQLPKRDGLEVLRALIRDGAHTRVVFLTAYAEPPVVHAALAAGASGYLSKDADENEICQAVLAAAKGETVLSPQLQSALLSQVRQQALREEPALSPREREILKLVSDGRTGTEIGRELHLSPTTVKSYMQRIYEKLGVNDRASAVAGAIRRGILE